MQNARHVRIIAGDGIGSEYVACATRQDWQRQLRIGEAGGPWPQLPDHQMFRHPEKYQAIIIVTSSN